MKNTSFFIAKAESLLIRLDQLDFDSSIEDWVFDHDNSKKRENFYREVKTEIKDIHFQIQIMFSEFDNGQIFLSKMNSFTKITLLSEYHFLIKILGTFVSYLNEYRIDNSKKKDQFREVKKHKINDYIHVIAKRNKTENAKTYFKKALTDYNKTNFNNNGYMEDINIERFSELTNVGKGTSDFLYEELQLLKENHDNT